MAYNHAFDRVGLKSNVLVCPTFVSKSINELSKILSNSLEAYIADRQTMTMTLTLFKGIGIHVGLQCVIVVFPDHTHLLLDKQNF